MLFLSEEKDRREISHPLAPLFSLMSSKRDLEVGIFFSMFEISSNYTFGDNVNPPTPGEETASCEICSLFKYSICYCKVYLHFILLGGGGSA